jgi:hypothetical protein
MLILFLFSGTGFHVDWFGKYKDQIYVVKGKPSDVFQK